MCFRPPHRFHLAASELPPCLPDPPRLHALRPFPALHREPHAKAQARQFRTGNRTAHVRRQRVRLDGRRSHVVQAARRLRRRRLRLHRHRRRLFAMGAGPQGRRVRDDHRQVAEGARQPRQGRHRHQGRHGDGPGKTRASAAYITARVEESLQRLQTDYIDLYQSHDDDPATPLEETLGAFARADQGRARCAPSAPPTTTRRGWPKRCEIASARACRATRACSRTTTSSSAPASRTSWSRCACKAGVGVIPYYALASGFLTGKYRSEADLGKSPRGSRRQEVPQRARPRAS